MNDNSIMPFGRYKGQKLANVPGSYLLWLYREGKAHGKLKGYIEEVMHILKQESGENLHK